MPKHEIVNPILLNGVVLYTGEVELNSEDAERLLELNVIKKSEEVTDQVPKSVNEMTISELKEYATNENIDLGDAKKKEEILAKIKEFESGE